MLEEQRPLIMNTETAAAATEKYSIKKVLLKIFQNSLENTCVRVLFFNKVAGLKTLAQTFSGEFFEFLKTPFFTKHLRTTAETTKLHCE